MLPVPLSYITSRRRERKALRLARMLVALDRSAADVRPVPTRRVVARAQLRTAGL